jgi:hypothetical protein
VRGLTFDDASHTYRLDGERVPSVTGILKASGIINFDGIPEHVLETARRRGTAVHHAIHYYNEHDLDLDAFTQDYPDYLGYLEAWQTFCLQRRFTAVLNEHRVASRRHRVAGTLDCLGLLDGVAVLVDFATGHPADVAKNLQTAAYFALALESAADDPALDAFISAHPVIKRYAVALRRDGSFTLEPYPDPRDIRKFFALCEAQRIVAEHRRAPLVEVFV